MVRPLPSSDYPSLSDYGLVGDGESAALVSSTGSVDWWCPERFDAPSLFARLLDRDAGGHFVIGLPVRHRNEITYLDGTNVLRSTLTTSDTSVTLTTFMPHVQAEGDHAAPGRLVRILENHHGPVDVTVTLQPGFDYARSPVRFEPRPDEGALIARPDSDEAHGSLRLSTTLKPLETVREEGDGLESAQTTVRLGSGDRHAFILDHDPHEVPPLVDDPYHMAAEALHATTGFWNAWIDRCTYEGAYEEEVRRSLLTLKLLQHAPSGSFVAAPTTSLPERPGGERNWDYRFAWLRDGYHTVMALESAGYEEEARRYRSWLAGILQRDGSERLRMLYRVDGERQVGERELEHLEGYRRSRPVRVGNEAARQHQLDTLGEIAACMHRAPEIFREGDKAATWKAIRDLVDWVCEHWEDPDSGLWELRGDLHQYVYGKAMAWVALDHGLQISKKHGFDAPTQRWEQERARVRAFLLEEGFDEGFGAFTQTTERQDADASNLLLPVLGFIDADDPKMRSTADRTIEDLETYGLCHRYIVDDRLEGNEGAFLVASFWLADLLAAQGRLEDAVEIFEAACNTAGPLGLLAEEADPLSSELVGNYPQALSHLGLILAAMRIHEAAP